MTLSEMRKIYLDYFRERSHEILPSASLIPDNDPTLLFTVAGMVQFKDLILGKETRPYKRAADSQKCLRTNDLDNVGHTARHHSFFEMLGNWSFGDYFKEESIGWSWDFLTRELGLDKSRFYFTVHPKDEVSRSLWKKIAGVADDRIIDLKDNVWAAGDVGPYGECTEVFYDLGPDVAGGLPGTPDEDGDRYLEVWNNVFMDMEALPTGEKVPLKNKNVDTGMSLERITSVAQGVKSNFDTDLFKNIISDIEVVLHKEASHSNIQSFRIIADHVRASSFLIADGVVPSNEGRGYVLRRIMRRAMRHINLLGIKKPAMFEMVESVRGNMGSAYPELSARFALIRETIAAEEESFLATLDTGLKLLEEEKVKVSGKTLPGATAFKLYDTYGFPLDLTEDILRKRGMSVDRAGFEAAMAKQREMSRAKSSFKGEAGISKAFADFIKGVEATEFIGYDTLSASAKVVKAEVIDGAKHVILTRTPFYAESGGQIADGGTINGAIVEDVQKIHGVFLHKVAASAPISVGDKAECEVDAAVRDDIATNHTAAHLLQAAMIKVLGEQVAQRGSWTGADFARFDFSTPRALTKEEIAKIELQMNEWAGSDMPVCVCEMPMADALKAGATALFGEKYGACVRVVSVGSCSVELCGGTHCANSKKIGLFKIMKEESISAGTRRVTYITGRKAAAFAREHGAKNIAELQVALAKEAAAEVALKAKEHEENKKQEALKLERDLELVRKAAKAEGGLVWASADIDAKNLKDAAAAIRKPGAAVFVISGTNYRFEAENAAALKPVLMAVLGGTGGGSGGFIQGKAGGSVDVAAVVAALSGL
jgi:alanyl-tRNA synthetase